MKLKFNGFLVLLLVLMAQLTFAQERVVSGIVTDNTGMPLPGVSVLVKGTKSGTQTDFDGKYSINTKPSDVLVFSYIGMETKTVSATSTNTNIILQQESTALSEVLIVGYTTTNKKDFIGSIKEVKAEEISKKNVSSVTNALAGEVSGVRVINNSGQPGTTGTVRIRGFGSVNGNRNPLYVVDGVPYSGRIESINPSDIASASVLKDATATAIYGARGANGVILITTKMAKKGESYIEVETKTGVNLSLLPRNQTIKSPEEYIGLSWEAMYNKGVILADANPVNYANTNLFSGSGIAPDYNIWNVNNVSELIDPTTKQVRAGVTRKYNPENWEDYAFQNSIRTEANLSMGGGSEKSKYFSSIGYLNDQGYSINSSYERITARLSLVQDVKEWLTASTNIGYTMSTTNQGGQSEDSGSVFWFVDNIPSIYPLFLRDANGNIPNNIYGSPSYDYGETGRGFGGLTNSIADAHYTLEQAKRQEISTSSSFNIKFTKDLNFETKIGTQYWERKFDNMNNKYYGPSAGTNGSIYKTDTQMFTYDVLKMLRYKKTFGVHDLEVLAAHQNNNYQYKFLDASKSQLALPLPEFEQAAVNIGASSYTDNVRLESYFAQANYDFDNRYYFTGTVRRDGSSRFLNDKWGNFYSVGAAWNLTNEAFMKDQTIVSNLKLKTSYGLTGEQDGVGLYPGYDRYNTETGAGGTPSFVFSAKANANLTWETSKMFQVGLEFGILNNRIEGSLDFYNKITDDLLFERRVAISDGYALLNVNGGQLRNQGFEFDVTGHIIKGKNGYLDLTLNGEMLDNKLLSMPIDPATGQEKIIDVQGNYGRAANQSVYDFYLREWAGVNPANGAPLWNQYYNDVNGNGVVDTGEGITSMSIFLDQNPGSESTIKKTTTSTYANATQKFVGKSIIPDVRGAVNISGGYRGFDMSVQMLYSLGGYAYDSAYAALMDNRQIGNNNWHTDIRNRWQQPGDITDVPRLSSNQDPNNSSASTRFITKANYFAINNVRLGYTFPKNVVENLKLSTVSLFISGDNLYISTQRKGFNPSSAETGASDTYAYSPLSTISGGIRVKF